MSAPEIKAPPPRNYGQEMSSALEAQGGIQNQLLGLQNQYMPQYQQLAKAGMTGQLGVTGNLYGTAIGQSAGLQNQQINANAGLYNKIGASAGNAYNSLLGGAGANLMASQTADANQALAQGANLSPQAQQYAQQSARAALSARGLANSNQGIAQEVFNNYTLGQQQLASNRAYAQNVANQNLQQANSAYTSFGAPQVQATQALSAPALMGFSQGMYDNPTAGLLFQPESQYNAQLISANQQNQLQANIANAQAQGGFMSGLMGMAGTIGGAFLGNPALGSMLGAGANTAGDLAQMLGGQTIYGGTLGQYPSNYFGVGYSESGAPMSQVIF